MKNLTITVLLILGFGFHTLAQDSKLVGTTEVKDNPNAPEIAFGSDIYDYGVIKNGADGTCEFKFKNTGVEPLIISNAKGSCGCTVPTWPKEPLMKGQSAVIKVHYDTKRPGAFTKTITIESNAKTSSKILTIKGLVEGGEVSNVEQSMPLKKVQEGATPLEIK